MRRYKPGDRVGVILSENDEEVRFCGFGTYKGKRLLPDWENVASVYAELFRNPDYTSEEVVRREAACYADLRARAEHGEDAEPTPEELEAEYERIMDQRKRRAEMSDEELLSFTRESDHPLVRNPYIETDNGEHWWGCETWWGREEGVREHLKRAKQAGKRIVEVTRADAGLEPQPPAD